MKCSAARVLVSRSLDGELDTTDVERLSRHLQSCPDCAAYERRLLAVENLIGSLPEPRPPEDYVDSLKKAVSGGLRTARIGSFRPRHSLALRIAASVAVVALTAAVAFLLMQVRSLQRTVAQLQKDGGAASMPDRGMAGHAAPLDLSKNGVVGEQLQVFRFVQEDLGGRLRWMAADGRQVEIGLCGSPERPPEHQRWAFIFAFRFVRVEANGTRRPISQPYMTVYPGAEARVRMKPTGGKGPSRFLYQVEAKRREDGRIAADLTFSWNTERDPETVAQTVWLTRTRLELEERISILLGQCLHEGQVYELWGSVSSRELPPTPQGSAT